MLRGSCLCGAVAFELDGALRPAVACHCTQCRKTSGHYWSATQVAAKDLVLTREEGLVWFRSSQTARRGFCKRCGSSLFWQRDGEDAVSVAMGALDGPTGLSTACHIYCADKGDYYAIADGLPQRSGA